MVNKNPIVKIAHAAKLCKCVIHFNDGGLTSILKCRRCKIDKPLVVECHRLLNVSIPTIWIFPVYIHFDTYPHIGIAGLPPALS